MANGLLTKLFGNYSKRELKRIQPLVDQVLGLEDKYKQLSDEELKAQTGLLKGRLEKGETLDDILTDAFAACREAMARVLSIRLFPVQVQGGIILHQGRIAEMKTGEGKTFTLALPAYLNALTGKGVHVVTVNEYLAKYQGEMMARVFNFMGMTVGLALNGMSSQEKKAAYACDITYGTNNEMGFDYLRDNMVTYKERKVQRGHYYAIVDEVDSILIDEARTPLIISGQGAKADDLYGRANAFARSLKPIRVKETDEKEDNDELYKDYDYIVNEKRKTCSLTRRGVKKAEEFFGIENLTDPDNLKIQHHVDQAIKAWGIMHRDQDYVVKDGEVIIVDEFTGRLMYGRRYNEGLHQAIEAKEGVEVARESRTLATITFQNYFRLYDKLSGMTGTAMTEQEEFSEIYKLDVVEIPTNRPMIREDCPDVVYKTQQAKFQAVINDIVEHHQKGQPVLVGTITIEKSELLSKLLKARGVKHEVLNAKFHEKEAQIVAQAGRKGAVTIATNMAGRGTDILLGGNAEFMAKAEMRKMGYDEEMLAEASAYSHTEDEAILEARKTFAELNKKYKDEIAPEAEEVRALGGLYIIGTERHESRRIDNQLRGRAGRQGDPGKSRFYISLEDDLMRLFGGERLQGFMDKMKIDDDTPIEAGIVSNSIEGAQRKVESRNFAIRKNVLQYDEVMNSQRQIIYSQRDQVLNGENMKEQIQKMIYGAIEDNVKRYLPENTPHEDWDLPGLREHYMGWLIGPEELRFTKSEVEDLEPEHVVTELKNRADAIYAAKEKEFTPPIMREVERVVLLRNVDQEWMDHIDAMEQLQDGIRLRAYAQQDPVVEYRLEGFDMFDSMIAAIRENTAKMMLTVRLRKKEEAPQREQVAKETGTSSAAAAGDGTVQKQPVKKQKKPGRNDPCPCGSGLKYKKCCGRNE
ncbi:preprotein translocase subunit SecA [Acutalibacter sp. LFL-21]|uniref:preprotein translocase subunit SecA n=1 Tax=Acutalibacter sp. LFL-21 TaxID=2983399 RepID=UPI0021D658CF|nr:preprotein translocase subunit SecA [Acutalibacter sp. LFL-21]MCU7651476.1 preprotein translocase subunit SecA [Acutalibacter sp. LFL-21]